MSLNGMAMGDGTTNLAPWALSRKFWRVKRAGRKRDVYLWSVNVYRYRYYSVEACADGVLCYSSQVFIQQHSDDFFSEGLIFTANVYNSQRKMLTALRAAAAKVIAEVVQAERTQLSALPTRVPLIHFAEKDLGRWQLQSDTSIGGFSKCSLVPTSASTAVFSGSIELEADVQRQRQQRSDQGKLASKTGFCAMRTAVSEVDGWPSLYDFHGLSLRLRPDARGYVLNVRADSILGDDRTDDLYQTSIRPFLRGARAPEPHQPELLEVRIPWGAFALTWRGCVQSSRPPPMNLNRLTHVGLLLADGEGGAFSCELESISAFRFDEDEQVHDPFVREALRLNVDRGYDDVRDG